MTTYLSPTEQVPLDGKHRWLAFAAKPGRSATRIESSLRNLGLYVWGVQESQKRIGTDEVAYTTLIEASVADTTPVKIAQRLGVNKLTLALEPVPWSIELWLDAQELLGPTPVPVDFLTDAERLNPGAYYGVLATWFGTAPGMPEVSLALKSKGYDVLVDESMLSGTMGTNKFFYIGTKDKNPSLRELRDIIKADALYINKRPFDDAKTLKDLGGVKIALEQGLKDFSRSTGEAAAAILDLGSGATGAISTLSKMGTLLLYALPVVIAGGLGYWGYTKLKES